MQAGSTAPPGEPGGLRILIADDQPLNRGLLRAMLVLEGHEVLEAGDGAQAVALFERERPDLVLMDVIMPVMDGYEATRCIKRLAGAEFVPVIFLTALTTEEALAAARAAGADDFLSKPYRRAVLNARIAMMRRLRAAGAALSTAPASSGCLGAAPDGTPAQWCWQLEVCGSGLQRVDPAVAALASLEHCGLPRAHRETAFAVLTELCNNAIEHGLLGLDSAIKSAEDGFERYYAERERGLRELRSGFLRLEVRGGLAEGGGELHIRVTDSGPGFDHQGALLRARAAPAGCCGRGIALLLGLCASLRYAGNGSTVEAVYRWQPGD